jgi:chromosome segregation ATPase
MISAQYVDGLELHIKELEQQLAAKDAEIARLKSVPMKYRRMAFNAQLQDENEQLNQQLADSESWQTLLSHLRRIDHLTKQIALLEQERARQLETEAGMKRQLDAAWQEIAVLKGQLAESENLRTGVELGMDCANAEAVRLRKQLAEREKKIVMLRYATYRAKRLIPLENEAWDLCEAALATTDGLSGYILCDAKPFMWRCDATHADDIDGEESVVITFDKVMADTYQNESDYVVIPLYKAKESK